MKKANLMTNKCHQKCFWRYTFSDDIKLRAALMGPCTSVPIGDAGTSGVMAGGQKTNSEFEDNLIEPTEGIGKVRDLEMSSTSSQSQILYPTITLHYQFKSQICKICSRCHEGAGVEERYHSNHGNPNSKLGLSSHGRILQAWNVRIHH